MTAEANLEEVLLAAVKSSGVPGASVAVLMDGEVTAAAGGLLNSRTGVEATPDSLFQIGSITKIYTATLVMQLVDAGEVDLDAPVRRYLPEFRVADREASDTITVRHLLTHTSGFDGGDYFYDGGRGDDTLARCVQSLADLGQLSAPGTIWSYNNAGFAVLGRLVEVTTGRVFDDALRERLLRPAGLEHSVTLPEEALLFRAASGHRFGHDGRAELVREWGLHRSAGPAGGVCASAGDVVALARLHLDGGRGLVSPSSVAEMQQVHATMPGPSGSFGLGWWIHDAGRMTTLGHDGGTIGQYAFLRLIPERGAAVALLTNGTSGGAVWKAIADHVTSAFDLPYLETKLPRPPSTPVQLDLGKYVGRYDRRAARHTIRLEGEWLVLETQYIDIGYDLQPSPPMAIFPVDEHTFVALNKKFEPYRAVEFLDFDEDGRPNLLFGGRLARRTI